MYIIRNEEIKMTKKYKVTQEFMDKLVAWRDKTGLNARSGSMNAYVGYSNLDSNRNGFPDVVYQWWLGYSPDPKERNNRLIAVISWLNGEDVFEVEKPNKFIVRSDKPTKHGDYTYILVENDMTATTYSLLLATKFNTYEEAKEWANSRQVVVEV